MHTVDEFLTIHRRRRRRRVAWRAAFVVSVAAAVVSLRHIHWHD